MPTQQEYERHVIGGLVNRPHMLNELDWLEPSHFIDGMARSAMTALRNLSHKNQLVDGISLARQMGDTAADVEYALVTATYLPAEFTIVDYAGKIRQAALKREAMNELADLVERHVRNADSSSSDVLGDTLALVTKLDIIEEETTSQVRKLVQQRCAQLEQAAADFEAGVRTITGHTTGVVKLDERIGGWQPGIVSIVAARPGCGKSSLLLATADMCSAAGHGVHLFSLEDTKESYADRVMSRISGVPAEKMRNSKLSRGDASQIGAVIPALKSRPWLIDSRSGITADEIVRSVRKHRKANGTKVVLVDYVQLVKRRPGSSAHEALGEIITTLADAAKHDGIAYVVASQLNRQLESRTDKRPLLSDLRESGSLEERAKCVIGMYRGSMYSETAIKGSDWDPSWRTRSTPPTPDQFATDLQLLVLKNSNGQNGTVWATFDGPTTCVR